MLAGFISYLKNQPSLLTWLSYDQNKKREQCIDVTFVFACLEYGTVLFSS